MIDITKIQAYEIPPKVSELQTINSELSDKNNTLKRHAYIAIGILAIVIIIQLTSTYKINNKEDENK